VLDPFAIGVLIKIIARLDRVIDVCDGDTVNFLCGRILSADGERKSCQAHGGIPGEFEDSHL
jgi:hypothetical protein